MTANSVNPFPDYAVTRLAIGQDARAPTIVTQPIALARGLIDRYVAGVSLPITPGKTNAALCAVRGDYGTGKTHLLNDAAAYLEEICGPVTRPSILRVTCIETDPLDWFRTKLGPQLTQAHLTEAAVQLYSRAGRAVAGATSLTASAADVLEEDPSRIRDIVRSHQLSVDEVTREFDKLLAKACEGYDETIRRVIARLVWGETESAALQWIRGEALEPRTAQLLGIPPAITTADTASAVIGAIAALHKAIGRPFVLLVDELEHFARFAKAHDTESNFTWLKRLLEELGAAGALALVAGHWSGWSTAKDYLDRFPQYAPIDLVKLEPNEILSIIGARVGTMPHGLGDARAQLIAAVTGGNMRRLMSLCNVLFRETNGFGVAPTEKQIHAAWSSLAQRIPSEQAVERIMDLLEARGFEVVNLGQLQGIPFDLVAQHEDKRVIVVDAKHAITESQHYDAARQFMDKLASAEKAAPGIMGVFLANGSVDDELVRILRSGTSNIRWFDLTKRDAMQQIELQLLAPDIVGKSSGTLSGSSARAFAEAAPDGAGAEATLLKAKNAELERKLRDLDERRQQETVALQQRLDTLAKAIESPRLAAVHDEGQIKRDRERASYEALLETPRFTKKMMYLDRAAALGLFTVAVGGIGAWFFSSPGLAELLVDRSSLLAPLRLGGTALCLLYAVSGAWITWRQYLRVTDYFDFSRQVIRDLYVRNVPIDVLATVSTVLRSAIEHTPLRRARHEAMRRLERLPSLPSAAREYLGAFASF